MPCSPGVRRGGAGRSSAHTFSARTAFLPLRGSRPIRDRAAFAQKTAPGSRGQGGAREGSACGQAKPPRKRCRRQDLAKTAGRLRAAGRPDGILRDPARAPEGVRATFCEACLARDVGAFSRNGGRRRQRPDPAGSLPSGSSAFSQRFIGHARPGIRAKAGRESVCRRDRVELDPALEASGSALSSGARRSGGPPSLHPAPHSLAQGILRFNQISW